MEIIHTKMVIWVVSKFFFCYCPLIKFTILWVLTLISLMIASIIYWFFIIQMNVYVCVWVKWCLKANCDFSTTLNFVLICKIRRRFLLFHGIFFSKSSKIGISWNSSSPQINRFKVREFYDFMHCMHIQSNQKFTRIKISLL